MALGEFIHGSIVLETVNESGKGLREVFTEYRKFRDELKQFNKITKQSVIDTKELEKATGALSETANKMGLAIGAGVAGVAALVEHSTRQFEEAQSNVAVAGQMIKNLGLESRINLGQMQKHAEELQKTLGVSAEEMMQSTQSIIGMFPQSEKAAEGFQDTIANLATVMKTTMPEAASAMAHAMNRPASGIQFLESIAKKPLSEGIKAQLRAFDQMGTPGVIKAGRLIKQYLDASLEDVALREYEVTKQTKRFSNALSDLDIQMGKALKPGRDSVLGVINDALEEGIKFIKIYNEEGWSKFIADLDKEHPGLAKELQQAKDIYQAFYDTWILLNKIKNFDIKMPGPTIGEFLGIGQQRSPQPGRGFVGPHPGMYNTPDAAIRPDKDLTVTTPSVIIPNAKIAIPQPDYQLAPGAYAKPDTSLSPYLNEPRAGRQSGGRVAAGMPYKVGESGKPELFVPDHAGRVHPIANENQTSSKMFSVLEKFTLSMENINTEFAMFLRTLQFFNRTMGSPVGGSGGAGGGSFSSGPFPRQGASGAGEGYAAPGIQPGLSAPPRGGPSPMSGVMPGLSAPGISMGFPGGSGDMAAGSDQPLGKPGTYRRQYNLSSRDMSPEVIRTIAGEARRSQISTDAVINNMLNRVGSKGWGPSKDIYDVATAKGQYEAYTRFRGMKVPPERAKFIEDRMRAIASGEVPDPTHGANSYRADSYAFGEGRYNKWMRTYGVHGTSVGGNRFAKIDEPGLSGPYSAYDKPRNPVGDKNTSPTIRDPLDQAAQSTQESTQLGRGRVDFHVKLDKNLAAHAPRTQQPENFDVNLIMDRTGSLFNRPGDPTYAGGYKL